MAWSPITYAAVAVIACVGQVIVTTKWGSTPPSPNPAVGDPVPVQEAISSVEETKGARLGVGEIQPDAVRRETAPPLDPASRELRCGEALGPSSVAITRGVEIFVRASYQGLHDGQHTWKYNVEFKNTGEQVVQMLTRHWIFVDAQGKVEEVKGPGARGNTPVLQPGGKWAYESGTQMRTSTGSLRGSFQFEVLAGGAEGEPTAFSAHVARLGLSKDGQAVSTPCGDEAALSMVPSTSVWATQRVIVGVTSHFEAQASHAAASRYQFTYDVQINNVMDVPITILRHSWTATEHELGGSGGRSRTLPAVEGPGLGGYQKLGAHKVQPGKAFRYQGGLVLSTPRGIVEGHLGVELEGGTTLLVTIGRLALSQDGEPVDPR